MAKDPKDSSGVARRRSNSLSSSLDVTSLKPPTPAQRSSPRHLLGATSRPNSPASSSREQSPTQDPAHKTSGKKQKKSACPCRNSSAGKDWVYKCTECNQNWHASCVNLKGTNGLNQTSVDKINKDWLCPWCWTCPFIKPGNHSSTFNESSLLEKTFSCSMLQKLTETVTETIEKSVSAVDLKSLESQLSELSQKVQEFRCTEAPALHPFPPPEHEKLPPVESRRNLKSPETPFEEYRENYLSDEELGTMADLLGYLRDGGSLVPENGHNVKNYGEPYMYAGSKSLNEYESIPPELCTIIEKLSSDLSLQQKPNSVLINHFPGSSRIDPAESHLAKHSDDEASILADSKIITISVGAKRQVLFESKHDEKESPVTLEVESNSMYVMSRSSQNWYRHCIPQPENDVTVEERFSITFRCLNQKFKRSIMLMGDSNTKDINFGVGSGKVGESFPGKREKAARVRDIKPEKCVGYQNIFVHCGTNDLRCEHVSGESYVHELVGELQDKLSVMKQLCPKANIFVVPVLPSRIRAMNNHIMLYNELVDLMLKRCFPDIWFKSVHSFLDNQGLLNEKLTRNFDKIHLGPKGIALYVSIMKTCVFQRMKANQYSKPPTKGVSTSHGSRGGPST